MCSPVGVMAGMQVMQTMYGFNAQRQQVKAQNEAALQNQYAARINLNNQNIQNNMAREDARINAMNQATDNILAAEKAKSTALVSGVEGGGKGQSLDQLISDYNYNRDVAQGRIQANYQGQLNQANVNQANYQAQYASTINRNQFQAKPNALTGLVMPIASNMMQYMI